VKAIGIPVAVGLALALQTTLTGVFIPGTVLDLVLVAVIYVALTNGPVAGMLTGSLAGIAQDALSGGIVGVGGLAKSTVGFLTGAVAQQFIMTSPVPRFLVFVAATALHAAIFMGVYAGLGLRSFASPWSAIASQAAGNAVAGMVAFTIVESVPGMVERRRLSRRSKL
jgi:rod shape-determining protein MreD